MNLLFICSRNKWRSPTAEFIYKNRQGFQVSSAGTEPSAKIKVNAKLIDWADKIFVMEKNHKQRLIDKFPDNMEGKTVVILDIADDFQYMDPELVEILKISIEPYL